MKWNFGSMGSISLALGPHFISSRVGCMPSSGVGSWGLQFSCLFITMVWSQRFPFQCFILSFFVPPEGKLYRLLGCFYFFHGFCLFRAVGPQNTHAHFGFWRFFPARCSVTDSLLSSIVVARSIWGKSPNRCPYMFLRTGAFEFTLCRVTDDRPIGDLCTAEHRCRSKSGL